MKIAILVNELNIKGGTHKQVLRLCQYLSKKNINFVLVTRYWWLEKTYNEFEKFEVKYLYLNSQEKIYNKNTLTKIKRKVDLYYEDKALYNLIPKDVEIVNVHDNGMDLIIKLAKKNGKKVVWQINDLAGCFNVGVSFNENDTWKKKLQRFLTIQRTKNTDVITVNVTKNAERVKACLKKNATVLYCGVDVNDTLLKHYYKKKSDEFNLLSMGVFFPYRNYETLIAVIEKMVLQGLHIRLDLVGSTLFDQSYFEKIDQLIKKENLENHIKIWGQVDDETYTKLFNNADAFAFINIEQSWGLAVFEAMSAGLPTIVSNSVGAIELLHHDKNSIIVDPKNVDEICHVIKRLMNDEDYYNRISDEAASIVKKFTWEKLYSSKMFEIFKKLSKEN